MFKSLSQSNAFTILKGVSKLQSLSSMAYSRINSLDSEATSSQPNSFISDFFGISVPGLTRFNQIVVGIFGVLLGVWLTFLTGRYFLISVSSSSHTGTILIQLLFFKLFANVSRM